MAGGGDGDLRKPHRESELAPALGIPRRVLLSAGAGMTTAGLLALFGPHVRWSRRPAAAAMPPYW